MALTTRSMDDILAELDRRTLDWDDRHRIIQIVTTIKTKPRCKFLGSLSLETRYMIYGYLLLNPEFGDPDFHGEFSSLSTSILRTCRQIYAEAHKVLYQKNTFVLRIGISAITHVGRPGIGGQDYWEYASGISDEEETRSALSFSSKVKRWRIVLDFGEEDFSESSLGIRGFCHQIFASKLHMLEILVTSPARQNTRIHPIQLSELLEPFRSLRRVEKFLLHAKLGNDRTKVQQRMITALGVEIKKLVIGNTPVDNKVAMHDALVRYISAFETYYPLRVNIQCLYLGYSPFSGYYELTTYHRSPEDGRYDLSLDECDPHIAFLTLFNTFHPIGKALYASKQALREGRRFDLAATRREILQLLEPRYQQIREASVAMLECVKAMKRHGFHRREHPNREEQRHAFAEGLHYLEKFADAFGSGDMPIRMSMHCKMDQKVAYMARYGELLVEKLSKDFQNDDASEFSLQFRKVVDHLNTCYLAIREARKELYKGDAVKPISGLGVWEFPHLCDEMVEWDREEPILGPWAHREAAEYYRTYRSANGVRWAGSKPKAD